MTSPLLSQTRAAIAQLEALKRQKGIVSAALVRESLPPHLNAAATPYDCELIAKRLNQAMAEPEQMALRMDHQARAAGEQ
jgi:hypothetical protein